MPTPLERILARFDLGAAFATLAGRLPGSDLTTVLLAVMHARARRLTPSDVVERYRRDRFTGVAPIDYARLRRVEDAVIAATAAVFEPCVLSPLAPFGVHSAIATVDQNKVVTTVRGNEVAADPTNALALEAAMRRRVLLRETAKSAETVRLVAVQRVVRAQQLPPGPGYFAHFHLAGLVSAGRDTGSRAFEAIGLKEHLHAHVGCALALGADHVELALTDFDRSFTEAIDAAHASVRADARVTCDVDVTRERGAGYYRGLCFKSYATFEDRRFEIGDGGLVDWTARLVGSDKERCFISGLGLDRLALAL
jgi:hypothetical protein